MPLFLPVLTAVPKRFEVAGPDPDFSITIPLAASEDGRRSVALDVRLVPKSWHGVAVHELKFLILLADDQSGVEEIYDRDAATIYVDAVRQLVMPCVIEAAIALINTVAPRIIYRATFATRPPEKALSKHHMITEALAGLGYREAITSRDGYGRLFWIMIRDGDE